MATTGLQPRCIYCAAVLAVPTRPAHVFPNGAGGRLTTTTTVCNDCNNSFANIEGEFCLRLARIGAVGGALRGDRKPVESIIEYEGSKWRTSGGCMYEMAPPPRDRGRTNPMPAAREDQVRLIVANLKARKLPPEALLDGRYVFEQEEVVPPAPDAQETPVVQTLPFGDRLSKRVTIKIAIELIAYFDAAAARASELQGARDFARHDDGHESDFRMMFDTETAASRIARVAAPVVHGIEVWTAGRKLHYCLTLFTEVRLVGTLTDAWSGGPFAATYTFDIKDPAAHVVAREERDGATLVNKSRRVRDREMEDAINRFEATSLANAERKRMRAPPPDPKDLYPDVAALMTKK